MIKYVFIAIAVAVVVGLSIYNYYYLSPNRKISKNRNLIKIDAVNNSNKGSDCIHFLNTESSDAILIESDGHFALVDCAEDSDNPRGFKELEYKGYEQEVLSYLKAHAADEKGVVKLDFILGTHSHSDHIGGFDTLILDDAVKIEKAYLKRYDESKINEHEVNCWDNKEVYQQMVDALNLKHIPIISDITETEFAFGNFNIKLFNTECDNSGNIVGENDNSIGMLLEKAGKRIFLAGDIDNITGDEDRLAGEIGRVDVLKVGHHSYDKSTTSNWLKTLSPSVCVVTNLYENTDKRTLRRIVRLTNSIILTTGQERGVIINVSDNGKWTYLNNNDPH